MRHAWLSTISGRVSRNGYESVSNAFDDDPRVSICYYSPSVAPVPIELDEPFARAQTEGADEGDPLVLNEKAKQVSEFLASLRPRRVVLVSDGDYGRAVTRILSKTFAKSMLTIFDGETLRPDDIIKSVEERLLKEV